MPQYQGLWLKRAPQPSDPPSAYSYELSRSLYNAELAILQRIGSHPRIARFRGVNADPEGFLLDFYPHNLATYSMRFLLDTPFPTRVQWLVDIAEGLSFLHSQGVAWNDGHFANMLLTPDLRVVLCDFGISVCPALGVAATVFQGDLWRSPWPGTPRQDVHAFGVAAFVLLAERWPHAASLDVSLAQAAAISGRHARREWDLGLQNSPKPQLRMVAGIVMKCWRGEYATAHPLLNDILRWRNACIQ